MDITTTQAENAAKATAWLTQNLPAETPAPAPAPVTAPPAATVVPPPGTPAPVVAAKPGLADAIRQDRDTRAAAAAAQADAGKYKGELEALRKENEQLKSLGAANDPFDFLSKRRLTKEQQAMWGQAFLYDLKPEVAPQEFRLDLYKAEQARKEQEQAAAAERAEAEHARQLERDNLARYESELMQHVSGSLGSNPESELWFSEDTADGGVQVNHRAYAQSLFATANNIATRAQQTGQQADLSPANIARVLEAEVSKRQARRDAKRAGKAATEQQVKPVTAQSGAQAADTTTLSAAGLRGGTPIPPATSDEERRNRAAAILFGTK